ncbi:MAG: hypothetical protein ABIW94_11360 [Gemmatimonadaceae bacterium]
MSVSNFDEIDRFHPPCSRAISFASGIFLALSLVMASGCRDQKSDPESSNTSSSRVGPADSFPPHEHDTIDAPKGVWESRTVRGALEAAGLGPVSDDGVVSLAFLGPEGTRFGVPGAEVQVYIYADAIARSRETDLIDSLKVAPARGHVDWRMPPSIIVMNNAAVIVLSSDEVLRKRIHAAVRLHDVRQSR